LELGLNQLKWRMPERGWQKSYIGGGLHVKVEENRIRKERK
jgi:hypothetical protein